MRLTLLLLLSITFNVFAKTPPSIVFYYNDVDSVRELINYDRVVVNAKLITDKQIQTLHTAGSLVFAYLSVGEYDGEVLPAALADASPAKNENWQSHAMILTNPAWQKHLLSEARKMTDRGFDGLFLDTLDSYYLFADSKKEQNIQQQALAKIIDSFHQLPNQPKLIINRGFEVLAEVDAPIYAVAAESLYDSYHPIDQTYHKVSESDRIWLAGKLEEVKKLGIEAIAIDYIPASDRDRQKSAAQRLIREGYTPYISDGLLYEFGTSTIQPITKRVLGFYDGHYGAMNSSQCHRMMAMPIEYNGYVPDCQDVNTFNFSRVDMSRYAAVFTWLEQASFQRVPALSQWLNTIIFKTPVLFINQLPADNSLLARLGIQSSGDLNGKITLTTGNNWLKNRYPLRFSQFETQTKVTIDKATVTPLITLKDEQQNTSTLFFKAGWGGAILNPLPVASLANDTEVWQIDPFRLVNETLQLPAIPAADVTTESGRRILTSHVDGDGFPSKGWFPGKPYTAEVLLEHVFKKYTFPQTVSVIEGEVGKRGLYPKESPQLEAIARKIFKLPHVEIASHTFSHPFFWDFDKSVDSSSYGENLPIPGYTVDYDNEIIGTINYINKNLAPKNKKARLILWSGKADPKEDILAIAEKANLLNVNGGNTYVVRGNDNFTQVSPTITWYPSAVHVYAPVLNENLYTNLWTEHHDGYGRAVETFQLLGKPRRLKTIAIYYHMYSGAYPASLKGLTNVYDWAIKQKSTPLYLSEYAERARTLYETGIAKTLSGEWQITSTGIKSIRVPNQIGYPVTSLPELAGWNQGPDGHYLILNKARTRLNLSVNNPQSPRLLSANAPLIKWQKYGRSIQWSFNSHVPFEMELVNISQCTLSSDQALTKKQMKKNTVRYQSNKAGIFQGTLTCNNI
ncbi:endo alpha-1,4 polygalactosaminidase [Photobacterium sanguinicancri]|uniref:endo alpha-1,4 polygalactosaminidase n=1 Tax=Photobacterium sanguinicancri TaxID=875932 RepID=UPI0007890E38|nr:endo alpha-1,4 polygalactosaminidase [Photobacterium sanguinicancri]KXI24515.1 RNA-binding protein [Photobacterium sanguinicancri]